MLHLNIDYSIRSTKAAYPEISVFFRAITSDEVELLKPGKLAKRAGVFMPANRCCDSTDDAE